MENNSKTKGNYFVNWVQSQGRTIVDHCEHFDTFAEAEHFATKELPAEQIISNTVIIIEAARVYQVKLNTVEFKGRM